MRLLNICIVAFFFVWLINFAYVNFEEKNSLVNILNSHDVPLKQTYVTKQAVCAHPLADHHAPFIYRLDAKEARSWQALTGIPSYQKISFDLPQYTAIDQGLLVLNLESDLQDQSIARLRISVNGQRSSEVVIPEGQSDHELKIELNQDILKAREVEVALQMIGDYPEVSCSGTWNGGAVVRIKSSTHLEIETVGQIDEISDRFRVAGNPYQVVWPQQSQSNEDMNNRLVRLALMQKERGYQLSFHDSRQQCPAAIDLNKEDIDSMTLDTLNQLVKAEAGQWPIELTTQGSIGKAQYFAYENVWTIPYDTRMTPNGELPTNLLFNLQVDGVTQQNGWLLNVNINDVLIHTERLEDSSFQVRREVKIPTELQAVENELAIKLVSSEQRNTDECVAANKVNVAQLGLETKLMGGADLAQPVVHELLSGMPKHLVLQVETGVGAAQVNKMVDMLHEAFGHNVQWLMPEEMTDASATEYAQVLISNDPYQAGEILLAGETERKLWVVSPLEGVENSRFPVRVRVVEDETQMYDLVYEDFNVMALISRHRNTDNTNLATVIH